MPAGGAIHAGFAAIALFVRQIPPPADATHRRHGALAGAVALPKFRSAASAVTLADSRVAVCVLELRFLLRVEPHREPRPLLTIARDQERGGGQCRCSRDHEEPAAG